MKGKTGAILHDGWMDGWMVKIDFPSKYIPRVFISSCVFWKRGGIEFYLLAIGKGGYVYSVMVSFLFFSLSLSSNNDPLGEWSFPSLRFALGNAKDTRVEPLRPPCMPVRVPRGEMYAELREETERDNGVEREVRESERYRAEFTMINRHRLLIVLDLDGWARRGQQPLYFGHHKERSREWFIGSRRMHDTSTRHEEFFRRRKADSSNY